MKKLDILIPQYNESEEEIKPLLDSIAIQQRVNLKDDVGVIIVNDGSDTELSKELFENYIFDITYVKHPHNGVSATRNVCLDLSEAEYVMFCDADDMFYNACGLWIIFKEINNGGFDSLTSVFVEELKIPDTENFTYVNRTMDSTFVHGKVHRRQYLIDNDIRWNEDLTIHEDSFFNIQCQQLSTNVKYCPSPFYLWRWRDNSVCRHDPKYILKTYINLIDSSDACVGEFIKRHKITTAKHLAVGMIYDCYFNMNKDNWLNQENQEYRLKTEKRFKKYYEKYKEYYETIDIHDKSQIIVGIKNRMFEEGLMMESITFNDWIKEIEKL